MPLFAAQDAVYSVLATDLMAYLLSASFWQDAREDPLDLLLLKQTFCVRLLLRIFFKVCPLAGCILRRAGRACRALTETDDLLHTPLFDWSKARVC